MQTIAIANAKGGTSKTTTTAALGAGLAELGKRVLLIDLDPKASLTHALGHDAPGHSMAEVIGTRGSVMDIARPVSPGLDLAPSDIALATVELQLVGRIGRELVIRQALTGAPHDWAVLDCGPSLSIVTVAALVAADYLIIPSLPSPADLRGVRLFLQTVEQARTINPGLKLLGLVFSQFDARLTSHNMAMEAAQAAGLEVIGLIPRSVRVQESAAAMQPITAYDPAGKPSEAYKQLTRKVLKLCQKAKSRI